MEFKNKCTRLSCCWLMSLLEPDTMFSMSINDGSTVGPGTDVGNPEHSVLVNVSIEIQSSCMNFSWFHLPNINNRFGSSPLRGLLRL